MSNCDSSGVPIDQDGQRLEDFIPDAAPFAISGDVFREIMAGKLGDLKNSHLETDPAGESKVQNSSSGGIPIPVLDDVIVEDYVSSDDAPSVNSERERCPNSTSDTVRAILRTSKHERDALYASRKKLSDVLSFLKSKGFTEEDVLKSTIGDGFGCSVPKRDDLGLPVFDSVAGNPSKGNPLVDKLKGKLCDNSADDLFVKMPKTTEQVFSAEAKMSDDLSHKPLGNTTGTDANNAELDKGKGHSRSWANVLKTDIPPVVNLKYFPMENGATVVQPPDEVLIKGNEKFKNCVVGTFSKGTHTFKTVSEFAFQVWKSRGLQSVFQKDVCTFVFRFANETGVNEVLSRGTWYISRRPMIVTAWGHKPGTSTISSMPIWCKFSNVPDCYWTEDGLARLASVIGVPLGADSLTAKMEMLPFAKIQVRYKLGDPLPNEIQATVLDPISNEKSIATVSVTYPLRPLYCSGCNSLGHSAAACPKVTRVWKQKDKAQPESEVAGKECTAPTPKSVPVEKPPCVEEPNAEQIWTEVKRKKSGSPSVSESSHAPPITSKNPNRKEEFVEKKGSSADVGSSVPAVRLTRTQKKKLKASRGSVSPSLS